MVGQGRDRESRNLGSGDDAGSRPCTVDSTVHDERHEECQDEKQGSGHRFWNSMRQVSGPLSGVQLARSRQAA